MTLKTLALTLGLTLTALPAAAVDFGPLRTDPELSAGLRWIAAADTIRNTCPEIEERTWASLNFARKLLNRAFDLGYGFGKAKAYVDDETEQARVRAEAMAYLRQVGAVEGDAASFCAVGRTEIDRKSQIGVLLRVR